MRPLLPSVALVMAVFLLGCQEQGTGVVELDSGPQFDRPDNENQAACDALGVGLVFSRGHCHAADDAPMEDPLVAAGRTLFFEGTFGGNGRTCGTCHRLANNMALDLSVIDTLPATDFLFVAEFNNDLTGLEDGGATGLLRTRGLILENIQGFKADPVFRSPPSLFNLSFTAPYGYNGNVPNLREFSTGAVIQHFPKTLARDSLGGSPDFVLPTEAELDSLEAFMLSLQSPLDGNFKLPNGIGRRTFRRVGSSSRRWRRWGRA